MERLCLRFGGTRRWIGCERHPVEDRREAPTRGSPDADRRAGESRRGTGDGPEAVRPGRSSVLPRGTGRTAARVGVLTVCQAALMVGFGVLITGPARNVWPLTVEDNVDEGLARIRTGPLTTLSYLGSEAGNTLTVIAITLLS
ncbi:hypothetical protein [Streptomyces sp. NPDC097610]|uniref:hypothetical protein n=1 Tax=Streptomyces sp. NPDC097610 TaxID=3157227 RepID=UPI0033192C5B